MELLILDTNLRSVSVIDTFESLLWTERYSAYGDFEIYTSATDYSLNFLQQDYYLYLRESPYVMIIEDRQISSDVERGNRLTVTGRSLESILERRIVWSQTILTGNLQNGIKKLLDENIISPTEQDRKISNFKFEASIDPTITNLTVDTQFTGTNLYDAIMSLCVANNIGFRVALTDDGYFVFKLYAGVDRSYDQETNPYVVFSPKFENIINSNYFESKRGFKTVTLVAGEGEGAARKTVMVSIESGAGSALARREMYTDARDISSYTSGGTLPQSEYIAQLAQRGVQYLSEKMIVKSFEGQVDATRMFKYNEDFFMGDVVQITNEYGMESKSRITEIVRSQSPSGMDLFPTFTTIE